MSIDISGVEDAIVDGVKGSGVATQPVDADHDDGVALACIVQEGSEAGPLHTWPMGARRGAADRVQR
jgi:hypothetical protein